MTKKVRLGLIGAGNIARQHIGTISRLLSDRIEVAAVCSPVGNEIADEVGAAKFLELDELIAADICDAVLIGTPTFTHASLAEQALAAGLHVLIEKPIALSVGDGERLLALAKPGQQCAVMLNQRFAPAYAKAKALIDAGELGQIQRYHWIMTNWFRPDIYFAASDWRGTWAGEGGGLLVNQCIHNLDIMQWLVGLPTSLVAQCAFGKTHNIEVEDEASALLSHANGASGVFVGSTGEAPGRNELEIVGEKATLTYDGERLMIQRNTPSTGEYSRTTKDMFGSPETASEELVVSSEVHQHAAVLANFADAILDGAPLATPASEGLNSLQLANGILLSAWRGERVSIPLSGADYQAELDKHLAQSKLREDVSTEVEIDMEKSFR